MNFKSLPFLILIIFFSIFETNYSQNLLDTSNWTIGPGGVVDFWKNGTDQENSRELGYNHIGDQVILWKATPDAAGGSSGGFTTSDVSIDPTKTYRYTIWLKKTNSNDGHTYLGCKNGSTNGVLELDGNSNVNPYFWYGDLPKLNHWYLIVGFVHGSGYTSLVNEGGIYDGVTGQKVQDITDFKFSTTAIVTRHRAFLYYDSNTNDKQYSYAPRIEEINGSQLTIEALLGINLDSTLIFSFDNSGNQKQRFYCEDSFCTVPTPPTGRIKNTNSHIVENNETNVTEEVNNFLTIYPNPTHDLVNIQIEKSIQDKIELIGIYNVNSVLIQNLDSGTLTFSLTDQASGVYFIHIHLNDDTSITRKIIKQ